MAELDTLDMTNRAQFGFDIQVHSEHSLLTNWMDAHWQRNRCCTPVIESGVADICFFGEFRISCVPAAGQARYLFGAPFLKKRKHIQ